MSPRGGLYFLGGAVCETCGAPPFAGEKEIFFVSATPADEAPLRGDGWASEDHFPLRFKASHVFRRSLLGYKMMATI